MYTINKSRNLVKEKGVNSEADAYLSHPIGENAEKIAMEYYINDDSNLSLIHYTTPNIMLRDTLSRLHMLHLDQLLIS